MEISAAVVDNGAEIKFSSEAPAKQSSEDSSVKGGFGLPQEYNAPLHSFGDQGDSMPSTVEKGRRESAERRASLGAPRELFVLPHR